MTVTSAVVAARSGVATVSARNLASAKPEDHDARQQQQRRAAGPSHSSSSTQCGRE